MTDWAARIREAMAMQWHEASDHAQDGEPFGGPACNCDRIAARAAQLRWRCPLDTLTRYPHIDD